MSDKQRTPEENIARLRAELARAEREAAALKASEPKPVSVEELDAKIAALTRRKEQTAADVLAERRRKLARLPLTFFVTPNDVNAIQNGQVPGFAGVRIVEA